MLASTFVGGASGDCGNAITLDSIGNIYVTGSSNSLDYPIIPGAYDEVLVTKLTTGEAVLPSDLIISKLSSDLSTLLASTFLGGISGDSGNAIALDNAGNVYVTGFSGSSDYPVTLRGYSKNGFYDLIVSKLSPDLSSLLASTFLGGNANDEGNSIAFDSSGNVYVTGKSNSPDYPTTAGAYDETYNGADNENIIFGGESDLIVSKLTSDLSSSSPAMPWLWLLLTNKKQEQ